MKAGNKIIYDEPYPKTFRDGKWEYEKRRYDVRIMVIAEGYAMIRCKGCAPFVESVKNLEKWAVSGIEDQEGK